MPAGRVELGFLLIVALATALTIPVVGTLLVFSLMIGAPAAARAICRRPGTTLALSVAIALFAVAIAIAGSYETDYPVGFFVGTVSAGCYVLGRLWAAVRRRRSGLESGWGMVQLSDESEAWTQRATERLCRRRLPARWSPSRTAGADGRAALRAVGV